MLYGDVVLELNWTPISFSLALHNRADGASIHFLGVNNEKNIWSLTLFSNQAGARLIQAFRRGSLWIKI